MAAAGKVSAGLALSASTITRTSGVSTYPPTVDFTRPIDWQDGDLAVMQWSTDYTFATGVSETASPVALYAATTTYNFGLSAIVSGSYFIRMGVWRGSRPGSINWSNIVNVGDTVTPSVTTSTTVAGTQYLAGSTTLTSSEPVTTWTVGGAGFTITPLTATTATLSWTAFSTTTSQSVNVTVTDYAGNTSAVWAGTLTLASNQPNAFTFTDVTGATLSTSYNSNTITLSGGTGGTVWPYTFSGSGTLYIKVGGIGSWVVAGTSGYCAAADQFYIAETSSGSYLTGVSGTLTVGTLTDTYTVTTQNSPSGVAWTPSTAVLSPQYVAYAASSATFSNIDFVAGLAIVCVYNNNRTVTGVTVGGSAATLVVASADSKCAIYQIVLASGGNKNVVVTCSGTIQTVGILCGTLTNYGSTTAASTAVRVPASGADPQLCSSSLTIPANGIGIEFATCNVASTSFTWNTGTSDNSATQTNAGGPMTVAMGHMTATATPSVSGRAFDTSVHMAAASWGP